MSSSSFASLSSLSSWQELNRALSHVAEKVNADSVEDMTGAELYIACLAGDAGADAACAEYKRRICAVDPETGDNT